MTKYQHDYCSYKSYTSRAVIVVTAANEKFKSPLHQIVVFLYTGFNYKSYMYIFPLPCLPLDYIQCPYCQRRFNESAADRHIKFCQEQAARMPNKSKLGDAKKPPGRTQVHARTHG